MSALTFVAVYHVAVPLSSTFFGAPSAFICRAEGHFGRLAVLPIHVSPLAVNASQTSPNEGRFSVLLTVDLTKPPAETGRPRAVKISEGEFGRRPNLKP